MDFGIGADINDAFASRMPLAGAYGGPTTESSFQREQVASPPVVLHPMTQVRNMHMHQDPPGVPLAQPNNGIPQTLPAGPTHVPFVPDPAPFVNFGTASQPLVAPALPEQLPPAADPSYFDLLAARRKDVLKLAVLALMVTLGIGIHSLLSHYTKLWIDSGQFSARQEFVARLVYPLGVLFALWNLKALQ
jgi:hypothetical protein